MFRLVLEAATTDKAVRILDRATATMRDLRPVWPEVARVLRAAADSRFDSQGASDGNGWRALSPEYAKWKNKNYPGRGILTLEGDLSRSLTKENDPGNIMRPTADRLTWGTKDEKADYHQRGRGVPMREVLRFGPQDQADVVTAIQGGLLAEIIRAAA